MKVLFLTRKYPPKTGGIENYSFNLVRHFKKLHKEIYLVANKRGNIALPAFIPYSFLKCFWLIKKHQITHLHLSDALLAPVGYLLGKITGVRTIGTVHGLDITYPLFIYQKLFVPYVKKLDKIICVSRFTREQCVRKGVSYGKCIVIPNAVNDEFFIARPKEKLRRFFEDKFHISLLGKKVLLATGRLVKRKGVCWFVRNVMPKLGNRYIYLISGEGKEKSEIQQAIRENKLEKQIFLLGKTNFKTLRLLYNISDLFVMPNIKVKGDMEGFGIVIIEAGSAGLPVIASDIEGIKDAVIDGKTGWLIPCQNKQEFVQKIKSSSFNSSMVRKHVTDNFSWQRVIKKYNKAFNF